MVQLTVADVQGEVGGVQLGDCIQWKHEMKMGWHI